MDARGIPSRPFVFLACLFAMPIAGEDGARPVTVAAGASHTIVVPKLRRAAVGSSKIARVTAIPPVTLLVTGVQAGATTVRAWDEAGKELVFPIEVQPAQLHDAFHEGDGQGVVKVSLEFLEVDASVSESLGVRWPEALRFSVSAVAQGDLGGGGLNYTLPFSSAAGWIHHLTRNGWARLLAKPDLYVRLGEEAKFHSGGEFPVSTSVSSMNGYHRQIEWKPYGLTVRVRPQSGDRLHVSSDVLVEIAELNPAGGVDGVPGLLRRNLDTKMNSLDGETVVLSGLLRQVTSSSKEGLPWLAHVPLLDLLFAKKTKTSESTELFMAVTFTFTTRASVQGTVAGARGRLSGSEP